MFKRIINIKSEIDFKSTWVSHFDTQFSLYKKYIRSLYNFKHGIADHHLSHIYMNKLNDLYSYLSKVYGIYIQNDVTLYEINMNILLEHVNGLVSLYDEFFIFCLIAYPDYTEKELCLPDDIINSWEHMTNEFGRTATHQ